MGPAALLLGIVACLGLCPLASIAAAPPHPSRDTTTVRAELASAREASRIPLLLELAELQRDDSAPLLRHADEALALLAKHPSAAQEIAARVARARALELRGEFPAALADAQRAEQLALGQKDPLLRARAASQLGFVEWKSGQFPAAQAHAARARELLAPRGPSHDLVRALTLTMGLRQSLGDLEGALEAALAALHASESLRDERSVARARNNLGLVYWDLGRNEEALAELKRALAIHERVGPRGNLANTLGNIGLVLIELDRPREAIPYLERSLRMDREAANSYGEAKNYSNIGFAYERLGQWDRAAEFCRRALELRERIGDREGIVRSRGGLGQIELARGAPRAAIPLLEQAIALAAEIGDPIDEGDHLEMLARARAAIGDTAGAFLAFRRFHEVKSALQDSASTRRIAELDAQYRARERERGLAALAEARQRNVRQLVAGTALLVVCLGLLGVLFALRLRAQRALRESEQRYRAVFQSSVEPTFLIETATREVLELNDPARVLCGVTTPRTRAAIGGIEPEWVRRALDRALEADGGETLALDDCWTDPAGRTRWAEIRRSAVSLGGRACRLVSVRDTTELRAQEEARQREEKMRSLGVLAGGIAHDFNNALTAIVGHVALAKERGAAEREELLGLAEQAAAGAGRLTAQLLAFAKGGQPLRRSANAARLLRESASLAGAGSHMRVQFDLDDGLWPAHVDGGQLAQVVSNLIINAQQATGPGGVLEIRARNFVGDAVTGARGGDRRYVRIEFADNGPGVPEAIRSRVFDPYFTTKPRGSGLGLATAYTICRNHGGTLTLDSADGRGATFTVCIPAAEASEAETPALAAEPPAGGGRILVLDDEPLVRSVLERMLERWGYSVEGVSDGRAAVERYFARKAEGAPFDLLLMDLTIPGGMGGRQAIAEIHARDPGARAIVASGYSDDPILANHRAAGFVAALAKPFQPSDLARAIAAVLNEDAAPGAGRLTPR